MHRDGRPPYWFGHIAVVALLVPAAVFGSIGSRPQQRELRPGDLVVVRGISFVVPDPGTIVWAEGLLRTGGEAVAGVETRGDGLVVLHPNGPEGGTELLATTSASPCADGAYSLMGGKWASTFSWYFRSGTTPSNLTSTGVEGALTRAVANITGAHNDCGLADRVGATASYKGRTSTATNMTTSATCLARDGKSVLGFGGLPSGYLGFTCWWMNSSRQTIEADLKLNKSSYGWTVGISSSCSKKWVVEAAATHELGHVFGLGHVSETYHPRLTMSPVIGACQRSETTLGLGDVRGLEALY